MKVARLSALRTGHLHPLKIFLVLIYVRGWAEPMAIVWPEGLRRWLILMTPSGFFVHCSWKSIIVSEVCLPITWNRNPHWAELNATILVVHPNSAAFHMLSLDQVNLVILSFRGTSVIRPSISFVYRSLCFCFCSVLVHLLSLIFSGE